LKIESLTLPSGKLKIESLTLPSFDPAFLDPAFLAFLGKLKIESLTLPFLPFLPFHSPEGREIEN
jgi:hypothetical protein